MKKRELLFMLVCLLRNWWWLAMDGGLERERMSFRSPSVCVEKELITRRRVRERSEGKA
jgi:hypothetical protein